ncbi:ferredoxin--NADP reductase [Pedobacter insulae]|uniref:Ring-1,2-phenylacetyl-CoA epoxidase subunit PaaE n=1 Tax=Pedobacter insulae TaxID=414048 RepID=A0A1I2ZS94_9SPHI|nr:ferredoxin--NADP reductase [Pedobacter insulae]SFH40752.1 ring-1,2-phenylacetyl-CoA epoxidase subunit PaaE [Pedobacter insulae]
MSLQKLRVISVSKQPTEVIKICFETLNGESLHYQAGQFLTLVFDVHQKQLRRSYSFCSSPAVDEPIAIAVKLVENGEISRFIHHQLSAGDVVQIAEPNGQFVYEPKLKTPRTIFLFAAGVGVTPLFSILKTALLKEPTAKLVLVYSSRSADQTLFAADIQRWQLLHPARLTVVHLYSNSKNLFRARLNGILINQLVKENMEFDPNDSLFYICGPVDYMDVCRITLLSAGFKSDQLKRETFVLPEDEVDEDDSTEKVVDKNTYSIVLHFNGKEHRLLVPYPKRILEVALENNINLPYSCSGGVCSTCIANCIQGGVRMDYNEVLTDDEIARGRVLVCTGHPTENETIISWE